MDWLYKAAQIFALVFTPLAVAAAGWAAQWSVSSQGVKKDLIQTAVQVLKEPQHMADEPLRRWALETINRNSEVRLPAAAADQLSNSAAVMLRTNPLLMPAMAARPLCPNVDLGALSSTQRFAVEQLKKICDRDQQDLFWMQTFGRLLRDYQSAGTE